MTLFHLGCEHLSYLICTTENSHQVRDILWYICPCCAGPIHKQYGRDLFKSKTELTVLWLDWADIAEAVTSITRIQRPQSHLWNKDIQY